jgi:hypothetical protein
MVVHRRLGVPVALLALAATLLAGSACSSGSGPGACALPPQPVSVTADVACQIAQECLVPGGTCYTAPACKQVCSGASTETCALPTDYTAAYRSANEDDAGVPRDGGVSCPTDGSAVTVQCTPFCP